MEDTLDFQESLTPVMNRGRGILDSFDPRGKFRIEHIRDGKVIADFPAPNGITIAAKNDIFNTYFNEATQRGTAWVISLIDNNGYTAVAAGDTLSSHTGWTEYTAYEDNSNGTTNRIPWGQGTASGQQITNASAAVFNFITSSGNVAGIFICDTAAKASSPGSGMLWSTALFPAVIAVQPGDQLRVTYTLSC